MAVYDLSKWHAALRRDEPATVQDDTGEVRIPLALQRLDEHTGDVHLVLARREVEHLHRSLGRLLAGDVHVVCATR